MSCFWALNCCSFQFYSLIPAIQNSFPRVPFVHGNLKKFQNFQNLLVFFLQVLGSPRITTRITNSLDHQDHQLWITNSGSPGSPTRRITNSCGDLKTKVIWDCGSPTFWEHQPMLGSPMDPRTAILMGSQSDQIFPTFYEFFSAVHYRDEWKNFPEIRVGAMLGFLPASHK